MLPNLLPSFGSGAMVERGAGRDPFLTLQREMNHMFDDVFRGLAPAPRQGGSGADNLLVPRMDVSETDNEVQIKVEMPGVAAKDVAVELDGSGVLTIQGEKKVERREERENARYAERIFGVFQRSLRLPFTVRPDQINANFEDGVLTVVLPKPKDQERPNRITVQSGTRQSEVNGQAGEASPSATS